MVAMHSSFLIACVLEVWLLDRPWVRPLGVAMLGLLVGAAALRYWVIATLGERWSTRVVVVPGEAPVETLDLAEHIVASQQEMEEEKVQQLQPSWDS
jgi:isoprenylcysteine carboxyl methyltransferase (ICMT) family protein YpbQ